MKSRSFSLSARRRVASAALLAVAPFVAGQAHAALVLTQDAVDLGFTLSTFATINPVSNGFGPFGVAVSAGGDVLVSNYPDGTMYVFKDVDGQTAASALLTRPSNSGTAAYATAGGQAYGVQNGEFVQFKADGAVDHVLTGVTAGPYLGMWGNLSNGHIVATSTAGLIDIDPKAASGTGSQRVITQAFGDGVTVSPDGKTAFLEQSSGFSTYDIATGALGYSVGGLPGADGTGVITSTNALNGNVVVNTNLGTVWMYNPQTQAKTLLASGGTRGDYVAPDTTNGTLFLDFSEGVYRLGCGANCGIGSPPTVPEPGSMALVAGGIAVVAALRRRYGAHGVVGLSCGNRR